MGIGALINLEGWDGAGDGREVQKGLCHSKEVIKENYLNNSG